MTKIQCWQCCEKDKVCEEKVELWLQSTSNLIRVSVHESLERRGKADTRKKVRRQKGD